METGNVFQPLAEFFLSNLRTWQREGRNRIIESLKSLDLEKVYFQWDNETGWLLVRCPANNKKHILKRYLEIQSEVESEINDEDIAQSNSAQRYDMQSSSVAESSPGLSVPSATIELEVPVELCTFQEVVAWQDFKPQDWKSSLDFLMDGAYKAIEETHGAKLHTDWSARVIFIGAASKAACEVIQAKLTTLLRSSLSPRPNTQHVFFVEKKASGPGWTVDVRDIKQINPVLAPSTLLDPLIHTLPEKYGIIFDDAYCLRLCYKDPFKDFTWSTFGPRAQDVFEGKKPQRGSQLFTSIQANPKKRRSVTQAEIPTTTIKQWIEELPDTTKPDCLSVSDLEQRFKPLALEVLGEDDPIPLCREPLSLEGLGEDDPIPLRRKPGAQRSEPDTTLSVKCDDMPTIPVIPAATAREQVSLLDGPISQDSVSILQPALRPHRRTITAPHPDSIARANDARPQTIATTVATDGSEFDVCVKHCLQRLIGPMKAKYGTIRLRAEIGRFYMQDVEESGVARNKKRQPAQGWGADRLVVNLTKSEGNSFFTKILSYWGNDADFLANLEEGKQKIWNPIGQGRTFYDFHFHARSQVGDTGHFVLEVDGEDFSWHLREAGNPYNPITVHCLSQHWDFRLVATHDFDIDQNQHFGAFARALVDSLVVRPPTLEFQYDFDGPPPIMVDEVRIRQVRRFQTQNKKTILDVGRVFPTEARELPGTRTRAVRSVPDDDRKKGVFKGWYEATISSARMDELLQQNKALEPGLEADWTLEQLEREGVFEDIYRPACQIVKRMDGVGVKCDNGMAGLDIPKAPRLNSSYRF